MRLCCPTCHSALPVDTLTCPNGHQFAEDNGVLVLLDAEFAGHLHAFTERTRAFRADEDKRLRDPAVYEQLPYAPSLQANWEWRLRAFDAQNVLRLLGNRRQQTVLDVGAWNGWLSHQLAKQGHQVTAIDYFVDEFDGLGAKKFYSTHWQAIQMDLTDLRPLDQPFDLIIINHGLHFFTDPVAHVAAARHMVRPGGLLILIGLRFYFDPTQRAQEVARLQKRYRQRYQADIFLKPTKGYLDFQDRVRLERLGIRLKRYRQLWAENLKSRLKKTAPWHYFGYAHL